MANSENGSLDLKKFFPETFKYMITKSNIIDTDKFECNVRVSLRDFNDFKHWLEDFEEISNTTWILKKSRACDDTSTYVFNRNYVCQHSSFRKIQKRNAASKKNKHCEASFSVRIKRNTKNIRYSDPYVKKGLTAILKMVFVHSHLVNNSESRTWLKRSENTRKYFIDYFEKGMTPSQAIRFHERILLLSEPEQLENTRINPPRAWVFSVHEKWAKENGNISEDTSDKFFERETKVSKSGPYVITFTNYQNKTSSLQSTEPNSKENFNEVQEMQFDSSSITDLESGT